MANRPIDDFDPRNPEAHDEHAHEPQEMIDDEADFGGSHQQRRAGFESTDEGEYHDDADFVDDDMNDIVDDADPLADENGHHLEESDHEYDEEEPGEIAQEAEAEMERAKSSGLGSLIFYIIIAGVVAGGGYMAYRSFTTGGQPVSPGTVLDAAGTATEKVAGVVVPTDTSIPTPAPVPADNSAPVPAATPVEANSNWQTTLPEDPAPAPIATAAPVAPVPQPAAVTQPPVAAAAPVVTPSAAPQAAGADPAVMSALNARLADAESRLQQANTNAATLQQTVQDANAKIAQLEQQRQTASSVTAPPASNAADLAKLRQENASLQKQVDQLTRTQQTLQAQVNARKAEAVAAAVEPKPAASPKTAAPKPAAKPAKSAAVESREVEAQDEPRSPKTRAPAAAKSSWVLRAATPGMAWVSPQPGSAELKRVVVGDQLAGIGQVTAIRQDNGRWIVEGSNGIVR